MDIINNFIGLTLQLSVPIVPGTLCGAIAEREGIALPGVEDIMLTGALTDVAGSYAAGPALMGVVLSLVLGGMIGWSYALFCLKWKACQSVVDVGINLLTSGVATVTLKTIWQTEDMSEPMAPIPNLTVPGLPRIPVLGALFKEQSPYLYEMFPIVGAVQIVFYKIKFGLRYRVMGNQPYAVQTVGVQINRYRYIAMITTGSIIGLADSYLFTSQNSLFVVDMTAGRGFMRLAANIFGGWQPLDSVEADMMFTVAQAARFYLTDMAIPSQFVQVLPYVAALIVLLFVREWVKGPEALDKLMDQSHTRIDTKTHEKSTRGL